MNSLEAIKIIKSMNKGDPTTLQLKALDIAYAALEKQIPKKPLMAPWSPAYCPCGGCETELSESLGDGYYKHWENLKVCPECGQSLDWNN